VRDRTGFIRGLATSLLFAATLFLFVPIEIYFGNLAEYIHSPNRLLIYSAYWFAITFLALTVGVWLAGSFREKWIALALTLAILVWLQSGVLAVSYGALDGQLLNFDTQSWRNYYEIPLWCGGLYFAWRNSNRIAGQAIFVSVMLIALQIVYITSLSGETRKNANTVEELPSSFAELSGNGDILHIILDGFGSQTFESITNYQTAFSLDGFTYYPDALASFSTTRPSIAAIMTGDLFEFEEQLDPYLDRVLATKSVDKDLKLKGFDTQLVSLSYLCRKFTSPCFSAINLEGNYAAAENQAQQLAGFALFRASPHALKPFVYNRGHWVTRTAISSNQQALLWKPMVWAKFLDDFTSNLKRRKNAQPVYRLLHVEFPHPPYVFNSNCKPVERRDGTFANNREQATCALKKIKRLLDRLQAIDLYDNTSIFIHSDHGSHYELRQRWSRQYQRPTEWFGSRSSALLLFKPEKSQGALQVSTAPASVVDIAPTIREIIDQPSSHNHGIALQSLKTSSKRSRWHWGGSVWEGATNPSDAQLFRIIGDHLNPDNWEFQRTSK